MLVVAFITLGVSLFTSVSIYVQHRRSGTPLPDYEVGAMLGSVGMPLVLAAISKHFDEAASIVLLIVGSLLTVTSAVMTFRARGNRRTGGR